MKKKAVIKMLLLLSIVFVSQSIFAQYVDELFSSSLFGGGISTVSIESPTGDIFNPAASGGQQRTTIDFSVIMLPDFISSLGGAGNIGITIPTTFGVFSTSGHFISSPYQVTHIGTLGAFNVSFAKDVFPDFYIGIGLGTQFGSQDGTPLNFGGGLDLGFIHFIGDVLFMQDFRWGIAIRGIGYGYSPTHDTVYLPRAFTPSIGANFKIVKSKEFTLSFAPDASFPTNFIPLYEPLIDLKLNLGCEISIYDFVFFNANLFDFDFADALDSTTHRFPFDFAGMNFGLSVKFKLPLKEKIEALNLSDQTDVKANIAFAPLENGVYGMGVGLNVPLGTLDKNPPVIKIDTSKDIYISPNNDGVQDEAKIPIAITDERFVMGYKFVVTDSSGAPVKTILNKDMRPENVTFGNIINRLGYVKQGIPIPADITWNGRSDQGAVVPDGTYHFTIEAWDDNNNTAKSPTGTIIVDATPPTVSVKTAYLIFSPNGDGNKDTLIIEQQGSNEDKWTGSFFDTIGNEVAVKTWENSSPAKFEWDGKNKAGILLPDGVYGYKLSCTDRAGNSVSARLDNIIINTENTPININIGLSQFSPNGDGIKDTLRINFEIPVKSGIEKWSLAIAGSDGKAARNFAGTNVIADYVDFDGKDDAGKALSEGAYKGTLNILYQNGNNPTATSPEFVIDVTPPKTSVNANYPVFSPNGDGNKDTVTFTQTTSEEDQWTGDIKDKDGKTVKSFSWRGKADASNAWDGRGNSGALLPDGKYTYMVYSTDKAGNYGESNKLSIEINTEETPVLMTTDITYFSPNGDGVQDNITFLPNIKVKTDIDKYSLVIKAKDGAIIKTFNGEAKVPDTIVWNGKDDKAKTAADGEYKATLTILYKNGNNPIASTNPFFIDTVLPTIELSAQYTIFSPNGDGKKDILIIDQASSEEDLWEAGLISTNNEVMKSFYWKGKVKKLEWDGKNEQGNKIPDGIYTYRILCIDRAGNKVQKEIKNIEIDTKPTPIFLTVGSTGFSPNKDGYMDTIDFSVLVENEKGIKSWKLEISSLAKGVIKTFSGETKVDKSIRWDGMTDKSVLADEGMYVATLTVVYLKGNEPSAKTPEFILDVTPPQLTLNMNPLPFSPDNDNIDDEVNIEPLIKDTSSITQWTIEIFDPNGKHFISFTGKGAPAVFKWDGLSDKGVPVESATDYPVNFSATDSFGLSSLAKSTIPIDILLMKVGNNYKIRIPSITFKPDTPDYVNVPQDRLDRNLLTLKRLSEIFKKYSSYKIQIEGHALSLLWADPKKAAVEQEQDLLPLSKKRAEAIKSGLVALGIDADRIETTGKGGAEPIVPPGDQENNWKNRRVEFILIKK
jgi:flagellar hook assembly protein FlgD